MSVGIAFRARLREPELLNDLLELARLQAGLRGWVAVDSPELHLKQAQIQRLDGAIEPRRELSLAGCWLNPHFAGDDLCLVFDRTTGELIDPSRARPDGPPRVLGFSVARTTFAGAAVQVALVELLEMLAARDLASVEMGDPGGGALARDFDAAEARIRDARIEAFRTAASNPEEPVTLGGVVDLLAPAEARRRREHPPGVLDRVPANERDVLLASRLHLIESWGDAVPGLDGAPDVAVRALEHLTDLLLSHPGYRREPAYLEETFAWEAGVTLGFLLIEALGGHWERVESASGPSLRVANLGGVGILWKPLVSASRRLRTGPLYAPDLVLGWLAELADAAGAALELNP